MAVNGSEACYSDSSRNSLVPGCDFKNATFKLVLLIGIFKSAYDNALK